MRLDYCHLRNHYLKVNKLAECLARETQKPAIFMAGPGAPVSSGWYSQRDSNSCRQNENLVS